MKRSVVLFCALGILAIGGSAVAGYRGLERRLWPVSRAELRPVDLPPGNLTDPLDAAVQSRFAHFDLIKGEFGVSRIIQESQVRGHGTLVPPPPYRIGEGPHRGKWAPRFRPKTPGGIERVKVPDDYDPVHDLQKAGWDTVLAVATKVPPKSPTLLEGLLRRKQTLRLARDPVLLTKRSGGTLPHAATLSLISGDLMTQTIEGKTATVRVEEWSYLARPVIAHSRECIRCHNRGMDGKPLLVGQPLGIAIYAFKRDSAPSTKPSPKQVTLQR